VARIDQPAPQSSAPRPGPTLVLELAHRTRARRLTGSVRIIPARDLARARRLVAQLG
jgi:hypothetical protein